MSTTNWSKIDAEGLKLAIEQARKSFNEGGIPIGSAILRPSGLATGNGIELLGSGHNQRIQYGSAILHGEMSAFDNAGRLKAEVYRSSTLYTTLSPCSMCTGAILLYRIPRVVIGEDVTLKGEWEYLKSKGVEIVIMNNAECKELMKKFIQNNPDDWKEDIGEQ